MPVPQSAPLEVEIVSSDAWWEQFVVPLLSSSLAAGTALVVVYFAGRHVRTQIRADATRFLVAAKKDVYVRHLRALNTLGQNLAYIESEYRLIVPSKPGDLFADWLSTVPSVAERWKTVISDSKALEAVNDEVQIVGSEVYAGMANESHALCLVLLRLSQDVEGATTIRVIEQASSAVDVLGELHEEMTERARLEMREGTSE